MIGTPAWALSDHYDIVVKANGEESPAQVRLMMRALLADRFQLRMHQESRERSIYVLTLARSDGSTGPNLRHSDVMCGAPESARTQAAAPMADGVQSCQLRMFPGTLVARAVTLQQVAKALVGALDDHREVRDKTGLDGRFDIVLAWTPGAGTPDLRPLDAPALPTPDADGPGLFTAIREQLGLKLEPQKDRTDVWVVDHVDRPTTN